MNIRKQLLMGIATAMVGLGLIGGGTFAYFNVTEGTDNTFATGLMELGIDKETIIKIKDIVPGDTMNGNFTLSNDGTVDMKEVILHTDYEVIDKEKPNKDDDLGDHIKVVFVKKANGKESVISNKTLSDLKDNPTTLLKTFPAESNDEKFEVRFEFVDNDENQNHFQGDELKLKWEFEAKQRDGK